MANIAGSHWGVRRWRHYDGTLTEAGKERYNYYKKKNPKNQNRNKVSEEQATKNVSDAKKKVYVKTNKWGEEKEDLSQYTNKELKDMIDRATLEKNYREAFNTVRYSPAKQFVKNVSNAFSTASEFTDNAAKIIKSVDSLNKTVKNIREEKEKKEKNAKSEKAFMDYIMTLDPKQRQNAINDYRNTSNAVVNDGKKFNQKYLQMLKNNENWYAKNNLQPQNNGKKKRK